MGPIELKVLEWAAREVFAQLGVTQVDEALSWLLGELEVGIKAADARVTGPFKGVADDAAAALIAGIDAVKAQLAAGTYVAPPAP